MTTVLVVLLLGNFALEAVCAYLLYKKRNQIRAALERFLGIDGVQGAIYDNFKYTNARLAEVRKALRFVRKAQKAVAPVKAREDDKYAVVKELILQGRKISAIKEYRNITGATLTDSVKFVNELASQLNA